MINKSIQNRVVMTSHTSSHKTVMVLWLVPFGFNPIILINDSVNKKDVDENTHIF